MPDLLIDRLYQGRVGMVGGTPRLGVGRADVEEPDGGPPDPPDPPGTPTWGATYANAALTSIYPAMNYFTTATVTPPRIGLPSGNVLVNDAVNKRINVFTDFTGTFRIDGFTFQGQHEFAQYNESDGKQPIIFDPSRANFGMGTVYKSTWTHTKFEVFDVNISHSASDGIQFYSGNVAVYNYTARNFWADNTGLGSNTGQPHTDGLHSIGRGSFDGLLDGFDLQAIPYFGMNCHIDGSTTPGAVLRMRYRNGYINRIGSAFMGTVELPGGGTANFQAMQTAKTMPGQPYDDRAWNPVGGYGIRFYPSKTTLTEPAWITLENVEFGPDMVAPLWLGPGTVHLNISDCTMYRGIQVYPETNLVVDYWNNVTITNPNPAFYQGPG